MIETKERHIHRGDIYYADLSPTVGSEQGGVRPVLILQNNMGNRYSPTVIAAAITSRTDKSRLPTHVSIGKKSVHGLHKDSTVLLEQIRTIDRMRLKEHIGSLDDMDMEQINEALEISMGLAPAFL